MYLSSEIVQIFSESQRFLKRLSKSKYMDKSNFVVLPEAHKRLIFIYVVKSFPIIKRNPARFYLPGNAINSVNTHLYDNLVYTKINIMG